MEGAMHDGDYYYYKRNHCSLHLVEGHEIANVIFQFAAVLSTEIL